MRRRQPVLVTLAIVLLSRAVPVSGQTIVSGVVAATTSLASKPEPSIAAAAGYRFNRLFGLGVEVTSVPTLKPNAAALVASGNSAPASAIVGTGGRATVFTANVRIDIAPASARIVPYVVAGGGAANMKETFDVTPPVISALPVVIPPVSVTQSSTDLVLAAGAGVAVRLGGHVSLVVDVRYLRLLGDEDLNVGRFGTGVSYQF